MPSITEPIAHMDMEPITVPDVYARRVPRDDIGPAFREHVSRLVGDGVIDYDWKTVGEFADRSGDYLTVLACVRGGEIWYGLEIIDGSDVLPAGRFRKAGKYACITREDNEREMLCGATGYVLQPEFCDRSSSRYVTQYCSGCDRVYRRENGGRVASSEDDTL
ncbi:hypothetical protein ACLGIH_20370 [Streptomyces sp. HMX87]|uniref:hypothetical protein n=1 Tax=Streptomyces sp. HMX87 TaxID=3390849 RepID=UPI003A8C474F